MNTLNILSLSDNQTLREQAIVAAGPVIRITPINQNSPAEMPENLMRIREIALREGTKVSLVTCRKIGVPESADGNHFEHFIIPASPAVQAWGVTF